MGFPSLGGQGLRLAPVWHAVGGVPGGMGGAPPPPPFGLCLANRRWHPGISQAVHSLRLSLPGLSSYLAASPELTPSGFWYLLRILALSGLAGVTAHHWCSVLSGCLAAHVHSPSRVHGPVTKSPRRPSGRCHLFAAGAWTDTGRRGRTSSPAAPVLPGGRGSQVLPLCLAVPAFPTARPLRVPGPRRAPASLIYLLNKMQARFPFVSNVSAFQRILTSRRGFC